MKKKVLMILMAITIGIIGKSQLDTSISSTLTPGGLFDNVFDQYGNKISLGKLAIDNNVRYDYLSKTIGSSESETSSFVKKSNCNSGYFQIYWDGSSGLKDGDAAANVICQVLSDISNFIQSPLTTTGGKVNVLITGLSSMNAPSNVLGLATSFHLTPGYANSSTISGIADNTVWQTIVSGYDAYQNAVLPIYSNSNPSYPGVSSIGLYFHCMAAFTNTNIHTDLSSNPASSEYDLYTIALHEFCHSLGFLSLIGDNKNSLLKNNYFSRYDYRIKNGSSNIISSSSSCNNNLYDFTSNYIDPAICNKTSIHRYKYQYGNTANLNTDPPVFVPDCYDPGSSFSHFYDGSFNGASFVMNPSIGVSVMKRHLAEEERQVLCDLGYKVNKTFGNSNNLNYFSYKNNVNSGISVVGMNDGIKNGVYKNIVNVGSNTLIINPLTNDKDALNKKAADAIICPEIVYGYGSVSLNSTGSISGTNYGVSFTYTSPASLYGGKLPGIYLIRYIPINSSTGEQGNITYVYIYVYENTNCVTDVCNMLANGGFESHLGRGMINPSSASVDCWTNCSSDADIHTITCATGSNCAGNCHLGTISNPNSGYTLNTKPAVTPNPSGLNNTADPGVLGLQANGDGKNYFNITWDCIFQKLNTSLIPGKKYTISFWATVHNNPSAIISSPSSSDCSDAIIQFGSSYDPQYFSSFSMPFNGLTKLITPVTTNGATKIDGVKIPGNNSTSMIWKPYTYTFTFNPSSSGNTTNQESFFYVGVTLDQAIAQKQTYVFVDDIVLLPEELTCTYEKNLPTFCPGSTIDLNNIFNPSILNGNYNVFDNGKWTLISDPSNYVLLSSSGFTTISYTYTTSMGCVITVQLPQIKTNPIPDVEEIQGPLTACINSTIQLTDVTPGGTWSSNDLSLATVDLNTGKVTLGTTTGVVVISYNVTNTCSGVTNSTKKNYSFTIINSVPTVAPISGPNSVCIGYMTNYSNATSGGVWESSDVNLAVIDINGNINPIATGTVSIIYSVNNACGTTQVSKSVNLLGVPIKPITGPNKICVGTSFTLQDITNGGKWNSSDATIANITNAGIVSNTANIIAMQAGDAYIHYSISDASCVSLQTYYLNIYDVPIVTTITGNNELCGIDASDVLSDATNGGNWSSSSSGVVSVDQYGNISAVSSGTAIIYYTLSNPGCSTSVSKSVTVYSIPVINPILGNNYICSIGSQTQLSDASSGGTWSSDNTSVVTVDNTGKVTAKSVGTANIKYSFANIGSCSVDVQLAITVYPLLSDLSITCNNCTNNKICLGNDADIVTNETGGIWSSSNTSVLESDNGNGWQTNIIGNATISYNVSNSCGSKSVNLPITVIDLPSVAPIVCNSCPDPLCTNSSAQLSNTTPNGTWTSEDPKSIIVDNTGKINTLNGSNGTTSIDYSVTNMCGTTTEIIDLDVTSPVVDNITGLITVCAGQTIQLSETTPKGIWSSSNTNIATITNTGLVLGLFPSTVNILYTVTDASSGCSSSAIQQIIVKSCDPCTIISGEPIENIKTDKSYFQRNWNIPITIKIPNSVKIDFINSNIKMAPGVKIIVEDGAVLNIVGSHLYGCWSMWDGIEVEPGGTVNITGYFDKNTNTTISSFIEDATVAVAMDYTNRNWTNLLEDKEDNYLNVDNVIFNRNRTSIEIDGYSNVLNPICNRAYYPFSIKNCLFTCRNIPFTYGKFTWDNIETVENLASVFNATPILKTPDMLGSPYIWDRLYPSAGIFMKIPYDKEKSVYGIVLNNNGFIGKDPIKDEYMGITIGEGVDENNPTSRNTNIFDNVEIGINATNTNLKVRNCTFQKAYLQNGKQGMGINVVNNSNDGDINPKTWDGYYKLTINNDSYSKHENKYICPPSAFFDQSIAIQTENYFKHEITGVDIRSINHASFKTGIKGNGRVTRGSEGILTYTDRYDDWQLNNNHIYNIDNPIYVGITTGNVDANYNPFATNAIYVNNNFIDKQLPRQFLKSGRVSTAIAFEANDKDPNKGLDYIYCNNNVINNVWRGIQFSNMGNKSVWAANNSIGLVQDKLFKGVQYGIELLGGSAAGNNKFNNLIYNNTINGDFNDLNMADETGINVELNDNADIRCNTVMNLQKGINFSGAGFSANEQHLASCLSNTIDYSNLYGLTLDWQAALGPQGDDNRPADNDWGGDDNEWINAMHYKTAAFNGTDAKYSTMYVRSQGSANYDPSGSNPNTPFSFAYDFGNYNLQIAKGIWDCWKPSSWCDGDNCDDHSLSGYRQNIIGQEENVASAKLNIPSADSAELLEVMQQKLYEAVASNSQLLNKSKILQSFALYPQRDGFWFGSIIGDLLSWGDGATALFVLNMWQPESKLDINYYNYYSWLTALNMKLELQPEDMEKMYALAKGCPFTDGVVVYWARNLYNRLTKQHELFKNSCGEGVVASRKALNVKLVESTKEGILVYPNPSKGIVNVQLPHTEKGVWSITITDIYGKVLQEKLYSTNENLIQLNIKQPTGIYLIKIVNGVSGTNEVRKIILQQ